MEEDSIYSADRRVKQYGIGVQVGAKLIPEVLKLSQIPSELCDDSGIVICSLDQSGEIEVDMARDSPESQIQVITKSNKVHGWWSGIVSGKTPLFENKSMDNFPARKSTEKQIENNLSLQGKAILQPETYTTHPNPRYRLVLVDTGNQNRQCLSVSASKIDWSGRDVQVGVKLIPYSIDVRPLKLENMKAVLSSKKARDAREVDASAVLCTSGVQYEEELTESTGVQVVQINESAELRSCHVSNRNTSVTGSTDGSKHFDVGSMIARNADPNTTSDADDSNFAAILRVKEAQYGTENKRTASYWESTKFQTLVNKNVQVELNLIPKTITVDKVSVENMEAISGQRKDGTFEEVGAVLVPTELKLEQMSLDAHQVPRLVESISTENNLCPTYIVTSSILYECSGVHITSVGALSEIAIKLGQGEYKAEVQRDTKSNPTRIAIKERSISAISIDDAHKALTFGGISNSIQHSMSSKSVQIGTILIPTTVTMEKVMVENLEVSVPLTQSKCAEVNVSAVLASSATEMTTVLINAPGIHIIPMSKVDEIGIQANGKNYIGMVEGAYQSARGRAPSGTSMSQDQQKIILPIASSAISRSKKIQASLLQQSKDLSLLHDTLRSDQTTPVLRETNTLSTGSFRRPGIIHIPGQTLTPIAEILSTP
ncbi:unnamed protein product [Rodentolepis nana]|uniref:Agenet-like domain-containing protein n=1 Tax=Rodentolepis nana TaxID=102285 RepID=A0A0R3TW05_RODNA|nr:unnamed protein product [Rodentolepis nana]